MTQLATRLEELGFLLRSGGADGADTAFEQGVKNSLKEIFLPWASFNGSRSPYANPSPQAEQMAEQFHPAWARLSRGPRKLMARNMHQVLGRKLDTPVEFVLCWTPDGVEDGTKTTAKTGGTGMAIRVATYHSIPVFNLANPDAMTRLTDYIRSTTKEAKHGTSKS
jgi:hypothetical protein